MSSNYDKPITTNQLAALSHLSEGYFCQIFKEVTGKTAMEYLNHMRIDKAEKMLSKIGELIKTAKAFCEDIEFSALDATRADEDFLISAVKEAENN